MTRILPRALCLVALTSVAASTAPYEIPGEGTQLPCEVSRSTPTTSPSALESPRNLRIIRGSGDEWDGLALDSEPLSGPFAAETTSETITAAAAANPHGYYEMLAQRADCIAAYSLRNSAQLATRANGGYSVKNDTAPAVVYIYPTDPHPRGQDAAKVTIPAGAANLQNQVRLPIPTHAPESLFVTWEGWFGKEWVNGGIIDQKTWQLGSPFNDIHLEIRNRYSKGQTQQPGSTAMIDVRLYAEGGYSVGPNIEAHGTLAPMAGSFYLQPETWTRWFVFLKAPAPGDIWYEFSLWAADANTDPVLIYDRLQMRPSPDSTTASWESFWLEFNTSSNDRSGTTFDLIAYVRNVAVLKGLADPKPLLQRPIP